jgi:NAD+ kinase
MTRAFKRAILYARQYRANQGVNETLLRVIDWLKSENIAVFFDEETALNFPSMLPTLSVDFMDASQDMMIVVGGDGSLLSAARMAILANIPVIGINRGRLGFLTDITPLAVETQLSEIFAGHYVEEPRFLLNTIVTRANGSKKPTLVFENNALNDVVLSHGDKNHLVEFDVYVNQQCVSHYRADGLIVSTPTGSTAYALSAGGPIMHPEINAIVLVPMFSHSLSSRPFVVGGDAEIKIQFHAEPHATFSLSCDSHDSYLIQATDDIIIRKNKQVLRLLHPQSYHYFDTLRAKLGWESKHQG